MRRMVGLPVLTALLVALAIPARAAEQPVVGVVKFDVSHGISGDLGDFCSEAMAERFARSTLVRVIDWSRIQMAMRKARAGRADMSEDDALLAALKALRIEQVCRGSIRLIGGKYYIRARRLALDGAVLKAVKLSVAAEDEIEGAIDQVAKDLLKGVRPAAAGHAAPVQETPRAPARPRVSVWRPKGGGTHAFFVYDRFLGELVKSNRFVVVDWRDVDRTARAGAGQDFSSHDARIRALRSLGVQKVFAPSVSRMGHKFYIAVKALSPDLTIERSVEGVANKEAEIERTLKQITLKIILTPQELAELKKRAAENASRAAAHKKEWMEKRQFYTNSVGMTFRLIPAGSFIMGSNDGEDDEKPIRKVTITKPFYMGVHEVTQEQYEKVTRVNPSRFRGPQRAVENVSWHDAQEFCLRLAVREKSVSYRLPTEAEWEYACRAGGQSRYHWGDKFDPRYLRYDGNSRRTTHNVGSVLPNSWGLYDMTGNVWEWCRDWYKNSYEGAGNKDPGGPGKGRYRVVRGGSWVNGPELSRSANRRATRPNYRHAVIGFRVVCVRK